MKVLWKLLKKSWFLLLEKKVVLSHTIDDKALYDAIATVLHTVNSNLILLDLYRWWTAPLVQKSWSWAYYSSVSIAGNAYGSILLLILYIIYYILVLWLVVYILAILIHMITSTAAVLLIYIYIYIYNINI